MSNTNENNNTKKGQHFLLSAGARSLSLKKIWKLSDEEAHNLFAEIRWADNGGKPVCHHCGNAEKVYTLSGAGKFKCAVKDCRKKFTTTSGTVFASHKLPLQDYLAAIVLYTNEVKGKSMLAMSRELDVQYKTAFVLCHKIREAIHRGEMEVRTEKFDGHVEVDGAYFNHHIRQKNHIDQRVDRRKARYQNPQKACVFTVRERGVAGTGAHATKTFVIKTEETKTIDHIIRSVVESHANITADGANAYNNLVNYFKPENVHRVEHATCYVDPETGASTNQAESMFARMRRGQYGVHHKFSTKYLAHYASEYAFREDTRRIPNGDIFAEVSNRVGRFNRATSRFVGYWQKRQAQPATAFIEG